MDSQIKKLESQRDALAQKNIELYNQAGGFGSNPGSAEHRKWLNNKSKMDDVKSQLRELYGKRTQAKAKEEAKTPHHTFVNSFGEATRREITNATYERAQKRQQKAIERFIGGPNRR